MRTLQISIRKIGREQILIRQVCTSKIFSG